MSSFLLRSSNSSGSKQRQISIVGTAPFRCKPDARNDHESYSQAFRITPDNLLKGSIRRHAVDPIPQPIKDKSRSVRTPAESRCASD